jgi:VWFA-related protein
VFQFARRIAIAGLGVAAVIQIPVATSPQQSPPPSTQSTAQQQPQQPQPRPPRFRAGTNLVRVDVYATTKDGTPVQDLTADDLEVYEDNAPQKIDTFEHIVVTPAGPAAGLVEPTSVTAANQAAADPRRRVFVIYLDNQHVGVEGSHSIKEPLIDLMQRVLGDDDLVGVMTSDMSPSQITFGRRTQVIEEGLRKNWAWGRRNTIIPDAREKLYEQCFPPANSRDSVPSALAKRMRDRRRERMVLQSIEDLVRHMEVLREGRTAVITISDGWLLYRPDESLTERRIGDDGKFVDPIPGGPPPVGVGPGGSLTTRVRDDPSGISDRTECEKEQMELAMMDNDRYFRDILGEANRANVSFYTIDPRGLVAFDSPIGPEAPPTVAQDHVNLVNRHESLHTLALNTDGLALLNSNDLRKQMRRIADDLTSYYLLGYYSTNAKADGRFRSIKVRPKRRGIDLRARTGYRAATEEEIARARASDSAPVPETVGAVNRALGSIESDVRAQGRKTTRGPGEPVVLHRGPSTGNQVQPAAGRVFPRSERIRLEMEADAGAPAWSGVLLDRNGKPTVVPVTVGERTDAATGQRWLTADITLAPLGPGDYVVELTTAAGSEQKKTLVALRVTQ